MLNFIKGIFGSTADPIAHRLPLDWFEQQLPQDLLSTGFHWVWESSRGFSAPSSKLPSTRPTTILTPARAAVFSADVGEYYLETHREMTAFATSVPMELTAQQLRAAIGVFAKTGAGPLVAILYQPPHGSAEVFLPRAPHAELTRLLAAWSHRLGQPIQQAPGGEILRRLFLKTPEAINAFPSLSSTTD